MTQAAGTEAMSEGLVLAVEALTKIADGRVGPERAGHYLAHRAAIKVAREALRSLAVMGGGADHDPPL